MTGWTRIAAYAGVVLAFAAAGLFSAVALFGDMFVRSDDQLRRLMDAVMYLLLAAVAVTAVVAAAAVCAR